MKQRTIVGLLLCGGLGIGLHAQDNELFHSEANVSAIGTFNNYANGDGVRQGTSDSGGVLVDYRYLFTAHQGIEIDYSFFKDTQHFDGLSAPVPFTAGIHNAVNEATASYVFRLPLGRLVPYLSAGTGAVIFDAGRLITGFTAIPSDASTQARVTFVYGGGADFGITKHVSLRLGYRGLVYSAPSFGNPVLRTGSVTHLAEPVGGFTYRF